MVVVCALLGILDEETTGAVVLGVLATAGLTRGTVFATAKRTPTDQTRLIWGSPPQVPDAVTPPPTGPRHATGGDPAARLRAELAVLSGEGCTP